MKDENSNKKRGLGKRDEERKYESSEKRKRSDEKMRI